MKIYTRSGDDGSTGLFAGSRVLKSDLRVDAFGSVDEANASIGLARTARLPPDMDAVLAQVQSDLFTIGAELACAPGRETSSTSSWWTKQTPSGWSMPLMPQRLV